MKKNEIARREPSRAEPTKSINQSTHPPIEQSRGSTMATMVVSLQRRQAGRQARVELVVGRGPGQPLRRRDASTLTRTRRTLRDYPKQWRQQARSRNKTNPNGRRSPSPSAPARACPAYPLSRPRLPRRLIVLVLGPGIPPGASRRGARRQLARPDPRARPLHGSTSPTRPCVATCKFSLHACMHATHARRWSSPLFPGVGDCKRRAGPTAAVAASADGDRTACSASAWVVCCTGIFGLGGSGGKLEKGG
jgi:hypothetical protein